MGRLRKAAAAAALSSIILGVPAMASATDPNVSITVAGESVTTGATIHLGDSIEIAMANCIDGQGNPGYFGQFGSPDGDPLTQPSVMGGPLQSEADGTTHISVVLDETTPPGTVQGRFFCASTPVTSIDDPNMLWVSPLYTETISESNRAPMGFARMLRTTAPVEPSATFTVDDDALPAVDQIGIKGPEAAALKQKVDASAATVARVQRLYSAFLNRVGDRAGMAYWTAQLDAGVPSSVIADQFAATPEFNRSWGTRPGQVFVDSAYQIILGRSATSSERSTWTTKLTTGKVTKAQLVQAIADSQENIDRTDSFNYVVASYQVLGKATPTKAQVQKFADRLEQGGLKVQVVEDVALSLHSASSWTTAVRNGTI